MPYHQTRREFLEATPAADCRGEKHRTQLLFQHIGRPGDNRMDRRQSEWIADSPCSKDFDPIDSKKNELLRRLLKDPFVPYAGLVNP